jgi:hypothetical protein
MTGPWFLKLAKTLVTHSPARKESLSKSMHLPLHPSASAHTLRYQFFWAACHKEDRLSLFRHSAPRRVKSIGKIVDTGAGSGKMSADGSSAAT